MRNLFPAVLLLLAACNEQVSETYLTWSEAEQAGAIERGWIPAFVPPSARLIRESHNLDTNRQTLRFTVRPSDVPAMVERFRTVSVENERGAAELARAQGFGAASEAYVVCSDPLSGALVVDRESGLALYTTTVTWADDECSEQQAHSAWVDQPPFGDIRSVEQ